MARIAGVNIPENKHIEISLTHIFGIGRKTAQDICVDLKIDYTRKISDLSEEEIENIRGAIANYTVEGDLRRNISTNIKRLQDLASYRGIRHRRKLPTRGHKLCIKGLGFKKLNQTVSVLDTPSNRGMIKKISDMVEIQEN